MRKINPAVHFKWWEEEYCCPPWLCATLPGYLTLYFYSHAHSAEVPLLCMLVLWKFKSKVDFSSLSPFKVHKLNFSPTCAAGLPRLWRGVAWRRNRELSVISSHKNTEKDWQATGSKLPLLSPLLWCRISMLHFCFFSPTKTVSQWFSVSPSKLPLLIDELR